MPLITPFSGITFTNTLSADVNITSTGTNFTGPTVAQGTIGRWLATGSVTVRDLNGAAQFASLLWDGTTTVASTLVSTTSTPGWALISLSGVFTNPAGNIRISVRNLTSTGGVILFNASGSSKDSTLTVIGLP